tara:strand:+ start:1136 stop:1654 length:519 start_codon:yes stop_codon:yes gene_type:complete
MVKKSKSRSKSKRSSKSKSRSSHKGLIAGLSIGGVVALIAGALVVLYLTGVLEKIFKKKPRGKPRGKSDINPIPTLPDGPNIIPGVPDPDHIPTAPNCSYCKNIVEYCSDVGDKAKKCNKSIYKFRDEDGGIPFDNEYGKCAINKYGICAPSKDDPFVLMCDTCFNNMNYQL